MSDPGSAENEFLNKITEIIEKHISDEHFGVSELAREMGMSRSSLHRKVKSYTKTSVILLISHIRLKHALELLQYTSFTVSEVAYKVGFNSPSYFIKCFHDYYGYTPAKVGKREEDEGDLVAEKSIIVLPFENISPEPDQEYFCDGLTEEVIADLSHIHDLLVISRSSAMTFKGTKSTIKEIADKVNVRYVLEGSVRKSGNNFKITAQLIDADTDSHLWAEKYNGVLEDVFDIQENVSRSIADSLRIELTQREEEQIADKPIEDVKAYEYYLRAKFEIDTFTEEGLERAVQYLEKGQEITGENALIYAGLAYTCFHYYNFGKPKEYLEKGLHYARKALELNPESSEGHFITGGLYFFTGNPGDLKKLMYHFKRALAINPNNCEALFHLGVVYNFTGKTSAVQPLVERHLTIDPYSFYGYWIKFTMYLFEGKIDLALKVSEKVNQQFQGVPPVQFFHALVLAYNKRLDEAYAIFDQNQKTHPENIFSQIGIFFKYALQRKKTKALQSINSKMLDWYKRDFTNTYSLVLGLSLIGEKDMALDWFEEWVKLGCINYPLFSNDPFLENIRGEERFKKLMKKVKYEWANFEV